MALPIQTIYFRGFIMCFECVSGRFVEGRSVDFWFLSIGRFFRYIEVVSVTLRVVSVTLWISFFDAFIHHFWRFIPLLCLTSLCWFYPSLFESYPSLYRFSPISLILSIILQILSHHSNKKARIQSCILAFFLFKVF